MVKRMLSRLLIVLVSTTSYYATTSNEQQITYLFSHGIADSHKQAFRYLKNGTGTQKPYIIPTNLFTFDYPAASVGSKRVNRKQVSLAQDSEVTHLAKRFYQNIDPTSAVVLIGVSCGASCALNFMSWYHPESVRALILESPFDSAESIVYHMLRRARLSWIPGSQRAGQALLGAVFKKYKRTGVRPIESVPQLNRSIPILLVCSLEDKIVPAWSTMLVYAALKKAGHEHVYLLILEHGLHAKIIDNPRVGFQYQNVAHAFYKKYDLPHDPELAIAGKRLLSYCQPSVAQLMQLVPPYAQNYFKKWQ